MADQGSEGLLSPFLREQRIKAARPHLRGRVLDFGCGGGALAGECDAGAYVGVDRDEAALSAARARFGEHRFVDSLPAGEEFDTVVALAVIEHLKRPAEWLKEMCAYLRPGGAMVLTTPHPAFRRVHDFGAMLGVFSQEASEEHETFLGEADLRRAAEAAGMKLEKYGRFLLGANQIAVLRKGLA